MKRDTRFVHDNLYQIYSIMKLLPRYVITILTDRSDSKLEVLFYSDEEAITMIISEGKSLSRFGDGEINWMLEKQFDSFQHPSKNLSIQLRKAFTSDNPQLLIGIPYAVVNSSNCNLSAKLYWRIVRSDFSKVINSMGIDKRIFTNASITRPYIDFKNRQYSAKCFNLMKKIWDKRNVIFVEGSKTKLGMGNDLFDNVNSIKRIICPAENAFEKLDEIKFSIRKNVENNDLILVALGPTASILASDLCDEGYQIVDIGHIDIEYMWFLRGDIIKKPIEGKYVNEVRERDPFELYDHDKNYLSSIIDRIL